LFDIGGWLRRPLRAQRPLQHFQGNSHLFVQTADHVDRQSVAAIYYLSYPGSAAQYRRHVITGKTLRLHSKLDGFHRIE
jgi:hypothetical protein